MTGIMGEWFLLLMQQHALPLAMLHYMSTNSNKRIREFINVILVHLSTKVVGGLEKLVARNITEHIFEIFQFITINRQNRVKVSWN